MAFVNLPVELQIHVLELLDPVDVISCRQTCHALFHVTRERLIWVSILQRLFDRDNIFGLSYDIPRMTLIQLEYAATSPSHLLRMLKSDGQNSHEYEDATGEGPQPSLPCKGVVLDEYLDHEAEETKGFQLDDLIWLHLVLGGRYLLAAGYDWLAIWDIDLLMCYPPNDKPKSISPVALASAAFDNLALVHMTPDNQGIRVFLSSASSQEYERFSVFEFLPQQKDPKLLKIAECSIQYLADSISIYSLSDNHLSILRGQTLNIWEYTSDKWCSIYIGAEQKQILSTKTAICILYPTELKIWQFPHATQFDQDYPVPSPSPNVPPKLTIQLPPFPLYRYRNCGGLCDWYSGTSQRLLFEYSYIRDDATSLRVRKLRRFELLLNDDLTHGEIIRQDCVPEEPSSGRFSTRALMCDNNYLEYWMAPQRIDIRATPLSGAEAAPDHDLDSKDVRHWSLTLLTHNLLEDELDAFCSFCAFSGRLVYKHDGSGIMIFDFLPRSPLVAEGERSSTPSNSTSWEVQLAGLRLKSLGIDGNKIEDPDSEVEMDELEFEDSDSNWESDVSSESSLVP